MGLEPDGITPKKVFDPEDYVTRAQFGTVLSRLIYGETYNIPKNEQQLYTWYHKHLRALNRDHIMKQINQPSSLEKRAWVLLMLKRTVDNNLVERYRSVTSMIN